MSEERDYIAEMSTLIEQATEGSDWIAAVVAAKLRARLAETDPDLLDGWLHAMAERMLTEVIGLHVRSERAKARSRAGSRAFREASDAAEDGDDSAIGLFAVLHVVDEKNTQKRAADMTGPEHLYVAEETYQRTANEALMMAAFHRAVAKKVGKRKTADVLTEQQYEQMYRSITHAPDKAVA